MSDTTAFTLGQDSTASVSRPQGSGMDQIGQRFDTPVGGPLVQPTTNVVDQIGLDIDNNPSGSDDESSDSGDEEGWDLDAFE
jgi:hypothetical protein